MFEYGGSRRGSVEPLLFDPGLLFGRPAPAGNALSRQVHHRVQTAQVSGIQFALVGIPPDHIAVPGPPRSDERDHRVAGGGEERNQLPPDQTRSPGDTDPQVLAQACLAQSVEVTGQPIVAKAEESTEIGLPRPPGKDLPQRTQRHLPLDLVHHATPIRALGLEAAPLDETKGRALEIIGDDPSKAFSLRTDPAVERILTRREVQEGTEPLWPHGAVQIGILLLLLMTAILLLTAAGAAAVRRDQPSRAPSTVGNSCFLRETTPAARRVRSARRGYGRPPRAGTSEVSGASYC